jgi:hypothetical protein
MDQHIGKSETFADMICQKFYPRDDVVLNNAISPVE